MAVFPQDPSKMMTNAPKQELFAPDALPDVELDLEDVGLDQTDLTIVENQSNMEVGHFANLVDAIRDSEGDEYNCDFLDKLGQKVLSGIEADKQTRSALETTLRLGFENLNPSNNTGGAVPFEGACDIVHPLIRENAVKYQAKFSKALLPSDGPARTDIRNTDDLTLAAKALKHQRRFNLLLTEDMSEFCDAMERLFFYMPLTGTGIKKVYFDALLNRPTSDFIKIEDFVISDLATDFHSATRYTHIFYRSKNELKKDIANGLYCDIFDEEEYQPDSSKSITTTMPSRDILAQTEAESMDLPDIASDTEVYTLGEQYLDLDMKDTPFEHLDGIARPYVATIDMNSGKILGLRRNWRESDARQEKIINFIKYTFVPGTGFYGLGLFHLLGDFQKTLTAVVRSLVDSGSFANLQAGFKKKGIRWVGSNEPLKPGELRDIDILGNERIQDVMMMLPFKEPSGTLFELMRFLTDSGQKFADQIEQVVSDSANYGKVGTTLALLEESSQFFSSIFSRVYKSLLVELKMIAELADRYMTNEPDLKLDTNGDGKYDIAPATDPNFPTRAHRLALEQSKLNLALQAPQVHNIREAYKRFYQALGESDEAIKQVLPEPAQAQPNDPLTDIQIASSGTGPIKAFPGQDHDAHIKVKGAFVADPNNQNPLMSTALNVLQANIREHMVAKYIEQVTGVMEQQKLAGEVGMAQASEQVAMANQNMATGGDSNPEMVYAKAEAQKAQVEADKLEADKVFKSVDALNQAAVTDLARVKEENRHKEAVAKLGIDAAKVDDQRTESEIRHELDKLKTHNEVITNHNRTALEHQKTQLAAKKITLDNLKRKSDTKTKDE